ncbi:unnamed protein product [Penicillium bialowiezense]
MQLSSFLLATFALAISGAWAQDAAAPEDDYTCLQICRDEAIKCQTDWISTQVGDDSDPCWTCCTKSPKSA